MTETHRLDLDQLSREELFSKVWSSPIVKIAEAFGISDVALKKRCRKLNIPTPNRGYWARIAAGQHIKRPKLPKERIPAHLRPDSAGKRPWPEGRRGWCQRARDFETALIKKGVGYRGLIHLKHPRFLEADILPDRIFDAARIFHALLVIAEPAGYLFKPYRGTYESGFFLNGRDQIRILIQDADYHRISQYKVNRQIEPTGKLMLVLSDHGSLKNETKLWLEADHPDLKSFTEAAASALITYREKITRQRVVEEEEQRIAHEEWLRKRALEKAKDHEAAMDSLERQRIHDLLLAAERERLHENASAFVQKLETTWLELGPLSLDQRAWLDWARAASDQVSMRSGNYPQIEQDGPLDRAAVSFGGPYPKTRDFPRPPTMPKMTSETSNGNTTHSMGSDPYPYWFSNR